MLDKLLTERYQRWMLWSLNIVLLLLLIFTLIYQSYAIIESLAIKSNTQEAIKASLNTAPAVSKKINLAELHLLGKEIEAPPPPPSSVNWILRGIILGRNQENNQAIIASNDTDENFYKKGDKLSDGSVISEISADQVTIIQNGNSQTLTIPWNLESPPSQPEQDQSSPEQQPQTNGKPFSTLKE